MTYSGGNTALLFVDPYNDFLSEGGKLWGGLADVARSVDLHHNLRRILAQARAAAWLVCIVPHHRAEPGDVDAWRHPTPYQQGASQVQVFAKGSWGGEWHPDFGPQPGDVVAKEHLGGSGFANTDLDFQLRQRGISHVVLVGLIANTCIETTGRFASELGYHVTLVRDATAAFTHEAMHAAHVLNGPTYAHVICTSDELLLAMQRSGESG